MNYHSFKVQFLKWLRDAGIVALAAVLTYGTDLITQSNLSEEFKGGIVVIIAAIVGALRRSVTTVKAKKAVKVIGALAAGSLLLASTVSAQSVVPRWQHSIFTPVATIEKQPDGQYHYVAFTGLGYQTAWTVYDKGNVNVVGIGLTHVINMTSANDLFSYTLGLNLNFGGNFGVGAGYDIVNTGSQTGLALGNSSWPDNGKLYFSFHLPLNGGGLLNLWKE